ncbi:MAG TPA: flagellar basal body L-ring protein FlgH [Kofleriaceae bacterium]|nr:flagellar basal body L-ring protein FlgH [Kofleriaceae bacterium]
MTRPSAPRAHLALAGLALVAVGCVQHIAPYRPRERHFHPDDYPAAPVATDGSIYQGGGLYQDVTAHRRGDIVIVRIDERDAGTRNATTKLSKKDDAHYGVPAAVGLLAALQSKYPDVDPTKLFATGSEMAFAGSGAVQNKGQLSATLPVTVKQELANGDLYIEGTKVVMIGAEEQHLYVSGVIRARDIAADGSIESSRIAEAEIEYTGRGDVSDQQRRGWGSRLFARIWPF